MGTFIIPEINIMKEIEVKLYIIHATDKSNLTINTQLITSIGT